MRNKLIADILANTPKDVKIFVDKYTDLVLRINDILTQKGYTQKDLADKLDKRPSEISKWLNGDHNFTLRSIAKLEAELGEVLLEVPKKQAKAEFVQAGYISTRHSFVAHRKSDKATIGKVIDWNPAHFAKTTTEANVG